MEDDGDYTAELTAALRREIALANRKLLLDDISDLEVELMLETSSGLFEVFARVGQADEYFRQVRGEVVALCPEFLEIAEQRDVVQDMQREVEELRSELARAEAARKADDRKLSEIAYREQVISRLEAEVHELEEKRLRTELQPLERAEFSLLKAEIDVFNVQPKFPLLLREQALREQLMHASYSSSCSNFRSMFSYFILFALVGTAEAENAAGCLRARCPGEISDCARRGDCQQLFACISGDDCGQKFPIESPVGKCLNLCANATLAEDPEISGFFQSFWKRRNAAAEKQLRSFTPAHLEFFFPAISVDESGPALRRQLLQTSKTRLLKTVDKIAEISTGASAPSLLEISDRQSASAGLTQLRAKIERDVDELLVNL